MAVRTPIPISQPLAPGLLAADYSPFSTEAGARSGMTHLPGFLNYNKFISTKGAPKPVGSTGAGLPMPEVEGYKYVYPRFEFRSGEGYVETGTEEDRDAYDYYPYYPEGISTGKPFLVGVRLVRE